LLGEVDDEVSDLLVIFIGSADDELLHFDVLVFGSHLDGVDFVAVLGALHGIGSIFDELFSNGKFIAHDGGHEGGEAGSFAAIPVEVATLVKKLTKLVGDGLDHEGGVGAGFVGVGEKGEGGVGFFKGDGGDKGGLSLGTELFWGDAVVDKGGDELCLVITNDLMERGVPFWADLVGVGFEFEKCKSGGVVFVIDCNPEGVGNVLIFLEDFFDDGGLLVVDEPLEGAPSAGVSAVKVGPAADELAENGVFVTVFKTAVGEVFREIGEDSGTAWGEGVRISTSGEECAQGFALVGFKSGVEGVFTIGSNGVGVSAIAEKNESFVDVFAPKVVDEGGLS